MIQELFGGITLLIISMGYTGLSSEKAARLLQQYGYNRLSLQHAERWWHVLARQFSDVLVLLLLAAALFSFFAGEEVDAIVIGFVILLNAIIGFTQELKAERAMEALENMLEEHARVIRDGVVTSILATEVVPGDVLLLEEGERVAADGVVLEAEAFQTNDSALTGESVPVYKDRKGAKVYMGTVCVKGTAFVSVQGTAMHTEFGRIAHLTTSSRKDKSPLQVEMEHIGKYIGEKVLLLVAILFIVGLVRDQQFLEALLFSVAVAVAAVPEGLPATTTIALALGMQRLGQKGAIVKRLSAVETLGSVNVICTDKTGTLTRNEMTVTSAFIGDSSYSFAGVGYNPRGKVAGQDSSLEHLMEGFVLCQTAHLVQKNRKWEVIGDPTEGALIVAARKCGISENTFDSHEKLRTFAFDSHRKMMTILYRHKKNILQYTKGAPDEILSRCTRVRLPSGKVVSLTVVRRAQILDSLSAYGSEALRMLALATVSYSSSRGTDGVDGDFEKDMVFEGLVGMIDPPRKEVVSAVSRAHMAGIRTVMITGDMPETAVAIGKKLGLVSSSEDPYDGGIVFGGVAVIRGEDLAHLSLRQLKKILEGDMVRIFARVSPTDKLRIVETLKKLDMRVAVTGDGVNDAPALKRADIGVAMGISGTDVSKEAADMILVDDSFATIVTAIAQGRRIYANMKKFIFYMTSSNIGELVVVFLAVLFNLPLPLTAILILLINLGTDLLPSLALGTERGRSELMSRPPRKHTDRIFSGRTLIEILALGGWIGVVVLGAFLYVYSVYGQDLILSQTLAFCLLVLLQLLNVFVARDLSKSVCLHNMPDLKVWLSILASLALVVIVVYIPFFANIFGLVALPASLLYILGISGVIWVIGVEIVRFGIHLAHRKKV